MIELSGAEELIQRFDKIAKPELLKQAIVDGCALVERTAKQNAPKLNGELRRSITSTIQEEGENIKGIVFTPLFYAPYVEYGTGIFAENGNGRQDVPWAYYDEQGNLHFTSGQHPHPFLRPALNENREQIVDSIGRALTND